MRTLAVAISAALLACEFCWLVHQRDLDTIREMAKDRQIVAQRLSTERMRVRRLVRQNSLAQARSISGRLSTISR